jgi:hypothetical protein
MEKCIQKPILQFIDRRVAEKRSRKSVNLRWLAIGQRAIDAFDVALGLVSLAGLTPQIFSG